MGTIIRPDFRRMSRDVLLRPEAPKVEAVKVYGIVRNYHVVLFLDESSPAGTAFRVALMQRSKGAIYPIAALPATNDGRVAADSIGRAVLQALCVADPSRDEPVA
jgi:hypothetical protein